MNSSLPGGLEYEHINDVNGVFGFAGYGHVMTQRKYSTIAHYVSADWVHWWMLPDAISANPANSSVPGGMTRTPRRLSHRIGADRTHHCCPNCRDYVRRVDCRFLTPRGQAPGTVPCRSCPMATTAAAGRFGIALPPF